jgi:hypothetical protein
MPRSCFGWATDSFQLSPGTDSNRRDALLTFLHMRPYSSVSSSCLDTTITATWRSLQYGRSTRALFVGDGQTNWKKVLRILSLLPVLLQSFILRAFTNYKFYNFIFRNTFPIMVSRYLHSSRTVRLKFHHYYAYTYHNHLLMFADSETIF